MTDSGKPIYVTKPYMPPLEEFLPYLERIWSESMLTNNGPYHQELERELCDYLGVPYISLFSNGTLALMVALQALRITGEVITTPYSFVATTHSLHWNGVKPVFVDIDPVSFNIDPRKIEAAITPRTTAIVPVHVYGNPCEVDEIARIADAYGLKVIYDAAHAFGVRYRGESLLNFGDLSVLSFHATKIFSTFEGGAIICHDQKMKRHLDLLKNFGFADETTVVAPGINAKMNEIQAAFGLLQLKHMGHIQTRSREVDRLYRETLSDVPGIRLHETVPGTRWNCSFFPILIQNRFPVSRDQLYHLLHKEGIRVRRYFYPLISEFSSYRGLPSARRDNLATAFAVAERILCLPSFPDLHEGDQMRVIDLIRRVAAGRS